MNMIIKFKQDGSIDKVIRPRLFKGSHHVVDLVLFAPFDETYTVLCNFTLPDGSNYSEVLKFDSIEDGVGRWKYPIGSTLTSVDGKVEVALNISKDETVLTTAITYLLIEDSLSVGDDIMDEMLSWDRLMQEIDKKVSFVELEAILEDYEPGGGDSTWVGATTPDPEEYTMWFDTSDLN